MFADALSRTASVFDTLEDPNVVKAAAYLNGEPVACDVGEAIMTSRLA